MSAANMVVRLSCPVCGLERYFPVDWRLVLRVDLLVCRIDGIPLLEGTT